MTSTSNACTASDRAGAVPPPDGLRFRRLLPHEDPAKVCQLFETVFQQPMAPAHWCWKYGQSPGAESYNLVVEQVASGRLVGHMGVIVVPGRRAGAALRMGQVCDVMLHPAFRAGIGPGSLYQRMNDALRRVVHAPVPGGSAPLFMYGFPGLRPANLGERIGVYRRMQICTEYTAEGASQGRGWSAAWARGNPWRLRAQALHGEGGALSDALLDAIWQRHCAQLSALPALDAVPRIVKNAAYVRWRYLQHPQQLRAAAAGEPLYTLWLLRRLGQEPLGWLVTRAQPQPIVVDSCLPPGTGWAAAAVRALPQPGPARGWVSWLPQARALATPTPIHAVEVLGQPFHTDWPCPQFQPGDTDVF